MCIIEYQDRTGMSEHCTRLITTWKTVAELWPSIVVSNNYTVGEQQLTQLEYWTALYQPTILMQMLPTEMEVPGSCHYADRGKPKSNYFKCNCEDYLHTNATKPNNQMASQSKPAARCKALLQQRKRNQQNGAYSIGRAKRNKMTEMLWGTKLTIYWWWGCSNVKRAVGSKEQE